ncbi:MAG: FHA domain-containing protein [Verrucomicrobiota bacterium]
MSADWAVRAPGEGLDSALYYCMRPACEEQRPAIMDDVEVFAPLGRRYLVLRNLMIPLGRQISLTLGCDPATCDVILMGERVSEQHARIFWHQGCYFVEDLDSANGTFVNGRKIDDVVELQPGDKIGLWPHVLVFR